MKKKANKSLNQHVVPIGKGWAVKKESDTDFFVITEKKRDAITVARKLAQSSQSELVIHTKDGTIRARKSYVTGVTLSKVNRK